MADKDLIEMEKIRDKETIILKNGKEIKRNLYSHYVSNNRVYFRYNNEWFLIGNSFAPFTQGLKYGKVI